MTTTLEIDDEAAKAAGIASVVTAYYDADGESCDPSVAMETETISLDRDGREVRRMSCGIPARARRLERMKANA
jgi:hypothetical protein